MSDPFSEVMGELIPVVDPRQRPAPRARPAPRGSRPRRRTSRPKQPKSDPFSEVMKDIMTPEAPPAEAPAQASTAPVTPPAVQPAPGIDFSQPVETVRQQINQLPEDAQPAAIKQWAETYVENERKNGGIVQDFSDVVRNLARGTVVGSWLDEANAVTASIPNTLGFEGPTYDEAVAYNRATDRAVDKDSTKLGELPIIGDVTAGGLAKLTGGIASAFTPATPMLNVARGNALLPQMANAAATGVGYGGIYGSGEGESIPERGQNALIGAGVGGTLGLGMPLAAAGVGAAATGARALASGTKPPFVRGQYVLQTRKGAGSPFRDFHPQAVKQVAQAFKDDFGDLGPKSVEQNFRAASSRLGPEGMLADMGPNLRSDAGAIVAKPGAGKAIISRAVGERKKGSKFRISKALNKALGGPTNIVKLKERTIERARKNAGPLYDEFYKSEIQISQPLAKFLQRAQALGADKKATKMMKAEGLTAADVENTGVLLDLMKRAVDDIAYAPKNRGSNIARLAKDISRGIRDETDRILSPADPKQSVWAKAREASGTAKQFDEGLELGDKAFQRNLNPDEMEAQMAKLTPLGRQAYVIGARGAIRDDVANAATQFGENSAAKARSMLGSESARSKLSQIADPAESRNLVNTLDAEGVFEGTYQKTLQNSESAARLNAGQKYPGPTSSMDGARDARWRDATVLGAGIEGAFRIANALTRGAINERRMMIAEDAARMLVAKGNDRETIARAMIEIAKREGVTQQQAQAIESIAQSVLRGSLPQAVNQATPD